MGEVPLVVARSFTLSSAASDADVVDSPPEFVADPVGLVDAKRDVELVPVGSIPDVVVD